MSFLKIGDRAAGAIKSGGTTRRAAKMVICDMDHPDIEDFINWKVIEEQKVAALVAGSKVAPRAARRHARRDPRLGRRRGRRASTPRRTRRLKAAIRAAKKAHIPEAYVKRVLQQAEPGDADIDFRTYDTDWDSEAYLTVSGQNSNNSVRVTDAFLQGRARRRGLGAGAPHRRQGRQGGQGARPVGQDRPRRLGLRRPGRAVPRHDQRLAHLPGGRPDPRVEPLLGVHVPRRHRLQPRVDEPAHLPPRRRVRRQGLRARHPALDADPRDLRADGAVPGPEDRAALLRVPHARPRLRQHRRPPDDHGLRLRQRRGPRAVRRADRGDDRRLLRHLGRDGRRARRLPRLRPQRRRDAARDPQPPPRRPGRADRLRGPRRAAGRARPRQLPGLGAAEPRAFGLGRRAGARGRSTASATPRPR